MEQFAPELTGWSTVQEELQALKLAQYRTDRQLANHNERIGKLERPRDDSRIRSLWSTPSPFPAPLSTYAPEPSSSPQPADMNGFDEQQNLVLSGLQLDEVDVPRKCASRANSVRFDDSATTNHWIHDSTGTAASDYFGSQEIGGYPMGERSSSHKSDQRSDGRQSSLRSFSYASLSSEEGSGVPFTLSRQNSGILDCNLHLPPPTEPAPSIIRCLPDTRDELILYAVVCTGSAKSLVDMSVINRLGLDSSLTRDADGGEAKLELPLWLPDAMLQQFPRTTPPKSVRVTVSFTVIPSRRNVHSADDVDVFLGSDFLCRHHADILFSQNKLSLYVADGSRQVHVPFRTPPSSTAFANICTMHAAGQTHLPEPIGTGHPRTTSSGSSTAARSSAIESMSSSHITLSSPKPVSGRQASVIRDPATTIEPPPGLSATAMEFTPAPRAHTTRGGKPFGRWESFSGSLGTGLAPSAQENTAVAASSAEDVSASNDTAESESHTRGRSLTNPSAPGPAKLPGSSVWSAGRKGSLSYSVVPKTDNIASTNSGNQKGSRATSRGMKVLRTSKSSSLSEARSSHQSSASMNSASWTQTLPRSGTPKSAHSRTNSGSGEGIAGGRVPLIKAKNSNVVGGATAFHWMAPKEAAGGGS